ncbi:MAG: zinc-binding dehydrogenase [Paracoccaceae bacterium]|nr:zinc-binding dehydrogenase [Paracoccaceae bacterium]
MIAGGVSVSVSNTRSTRRPIEEPHDTRPGLADMEVSEDRKADLLALAPAISAGGIGPAIDRRFPFAGIARAHCHVECRHRKGAIVFDIAPAPARAA